MFATFVLHFVDEMCIDYCVRYELLDACVKGAQPFLSKQSSVKYKDHTVCRQFHYNRYLRFFIRPYSHEFHSFLYEFSVNFCFKIVVL